MFPQPKNIRFQTRGFTLIELLVVIAIIGVLGSLIFGGFGKMRDRATATNCSANLRQIGMGMMQYAADNGNFFPPTYGEKGPWSKALVDGGYVQDTRVFKCPGDTQNIAPVGKARSYCYCSPVMSGNNYEDPTVPLNRLKIEKLSKQYLITEWHSNSSYVTWDGGNALWAGWDIANSPVGRHNEAGRSFLFADGHVEQRAKAKAGDPLAGWVLNQVTNE